MDTGVEQTREHPIKQIDVHTDTRDILARHGPDRPTERAA